MILKLQIAFTWKRRDVSNPPPLLRFRSSQTFILATICIAIFTDIFLYGVIVPVIPFALTTRVGLPKQEIQHWVSVLLAVYGGALLGTSPICGFLADMTPNRRLPLLVGLLALAGSTLLLCLGTTIALLLLGRVLQGISAAIVWTVGLALLADTVGHDTIGQAVGYVSISMSSAILLAPLLGGVVYDKAGYFSVYYVAFGMIILDIFLRLFLVEKKVARKWITEETITAEAPPEEKSVPQGSAVAPSPVPAPPPQPSPSAPFTEPSQQQGQEERHQQQPKPHKAILLLLSSRRLLAALFCALSQSILLTAWDAVLPLYVNRLFGWSSIGGGLIFLPLILPSLLAPLVGYWSDKKGPRWPTFIGFLTAIPFLVLLRFVDHGGIRQIVLLCALLALLGITLTNAMTPLLAEITYVVSHKEQTHPGAFGGRGAYATAYGLFNTAFAGGMLVGPLWGGLVTQTAGWGTMCWSLAVLSVGGAGVAVLFIGGWIGGNQRGRNEGVGAVQ
ncbi:MAG: hypothetical protein Q9217_000042 [Psora testacea]